MDRSVDCRRYVRRLGIAVAAAMRVRAELLSEFARLDRVPSEALHRAGRIGRRCGPAFEQARWAVRGLTPPLGGQACSDALVGWLDVHLAVCDALTRAGGTQDPRHLSAAAAMLRSAQPLAQHFNTARRRLAAGLAA